MKKKISPRIIVAPLDWGLGHATRCIPIIKTLLDAGCSVYIACNATAQQLLFHEFSNLHFLPLEGYKIRYSSSKRTFAFKILQQIPKIIFAIRRENKWLKKAVEEYQFDLIISDNRYGFFHKTTPSFFITHQLFIQTPFVLISKMIQKINYNFINRFTRCWVPDFPTIPNIAGVLSHPKKLPNLPINYIGALSRFNKDNKALIKYKWLFIISGPEPQRTLFEELCCNVIKFLQGDILLIRGLPGSTETVAVPKHCTVFNHLSTQQLQTAFAQSEYVISRAGYTTIMEIIMMQKKSILIPTPGQTEQEFLAKHLVQQHWCFACRQQDDFYEQIQKAEAFPYQLPQLPPTNLEGVVNNALYKYC